jgi:hypothetical protein
MGWIEAQLKDNELTDTSKKIIHNQDRDGKYDKRWKHLFQKETESY